MDMERDPHLYLAVEEETCVTGQGGGGGSNVTRSEKNDAIGRAERRASDLRIPRKSPLLIISLYEKFLSPDWADPPLCWDDASLNRADDMEVCMLSTIMPTVFFADIFCPF